MRIKWIRRSDGFSVEVTGLSLSTYTKLVNNIDPLWITIC